MNEAAKPGVFSDLLAGRWQAPLALLAALVGTAALYRLIPAAPEVNFDAVLADVALLERTGDPAAAAEALNIVLERHPTLPAAQRAILHEQLAEILFEGERNTLDHNLDSVREFLRHDEAACELGIPFTPQRILKTAFAKQWLGEDAAARKGFRDALGLELSPEDRRAALRGLIELLERTPDARLERRAVLDELLADAGLPAKYVWWGLHRGVRDALDENDPPVARELLEQHGDRLKTSELGGYLNYLLASVLLREGRPQEAEPVVRWIDDWLAAEDRAASELDDFGHLASLNRWLMGQIQLAEKRPQEAYDAFEGALELHRSRDVLVAASVGRGRALAAMGAHDDARVAFRDALDSLGGGGDRRERAAREFQRALCDAFDERQAAGDFPNALAYLGMAAELSPLPLAEPGAAVPELAEPERFEPRDDLAWPRVQRATELLLLDEPRLAWFLWSAADAYDRAGRLEELSQALHVFVEGRSTDPRLPQALLRLGHACEALGKVDEARDWYGRVTDEYPRLGEAARARVLTAGLLVSLGSGYYAEAEHILSDMLVDGAVTPDSAVYRDALLALCELLDQQGRYSDSISRLYEFLDLYPTDPEHSRAGFALADAHRRSGYALRDAPATEAASRDRFRRAADLFESLARELEGEAQPDEALRLYSRLALTYRADCLFELNEPEALEEALAAYREVASRYDGQPAALVARVQMANLLLRRGETREAARTLEGARWLLTRMKPDVFSPRDGGARGDWERFLTVVSSSELFNSAKAGGR